MLYKMLLIKLTLHLIVLKDNSLNHVKGLSLILKECIDGLLVVALYFKKLWHHWWRSFLKFIKHILQYLSVTLPMFSILSQKKT